MASYTRLRKPGPGNYGSNRYMAHLSNFVSRPEVYQDEDGVSYETGEFEAGYPYGHVSVDASAPTFLVHHSDDASNDTHYGRISKETGLDPKFLAHLHSKASDYDSDDAPYPVDEELSDALHSTPEDPTWDEDIKHIKNHPWAKPDTLFTHVPGKVTVDEAFFDKDARHMFPTVLGIIKNDYPSHDIVPGESLSQHSYKFSKHARDMGLLDQKHLDEVSETDNGLDFESRLEGLPYPAYFPTAETIDKSEVREGRNVIRQALRSNRPKKPQLSEQFDHPMLPGIE
jgi:hypothetical protein